MMRGLWNGGGVGTGFTQTKVVHVNPPPQLNHIHPGNRPGNQMLATKYQQQISYIERGSTYRTVTKVYLRLSTLIHLHMLPL